MIQTIISATVVFISTSIDYLLIITIIFAQARTRKNIVHVIWGQYLGTAILVVASLLVAYVLHFIPEEWIIGFLGLIPVILGIRAAIKGGREDEEEVEEEIRQEEDEVAEKLESRKAGRLFWTIALITIASGGDNLGVYIPYFASISVGEILLAMVIFAVATAALCYIGYRLSAIRLVAGTLEKYERVIVPVVFIALGIYIMAESGTIGKILQFAGFR